jgi:hypothetical protein
MPSIYRSLLCTLVATLASPGFAQGTFRLADPQPLSATGSGWSVQPRLGHLAVSLPVASIPGPIPIQASYVVNGSDKNQVTSYYTATQIINRQIWTLDYSVTVDRPIYGGMHFGYIAPAYTDPNGATDQATYVLESGTQLRESDWVPFTNFNATFTLPEDFGLTPKAPASVKVANSGSLALYAATATDLGTAVKDAVLAALPINYAASNNDFRVIMDKDLARIYVFLTPLNTWAPVMWLDRFGHRVTFQWKRFTGTALPAGLTAIDSVEAKNHLNKGVQIQWASFSSNASVQDLLKLSFIGVNAPTLLVKGYPNVASQWPVGMGPMPTGAAGDSFYGFVPPSLAGPIGRPTQIQMGASGSIASPSWIGAGAPLPAPTVDGSVSAPTLTWGFEYDANQAEITALTDALGVRTVLTYETGTAPNPYSGANLAKRFGPVKIRGVMQSVSTDPATGTTFSRSWTRGTTAANEPKTVIKQTFGNLATSTRSSELIYAPSTNALTYGNATVTKTNLYDGSQVLASVVNGLVSAGLDGTYDNVSGQTIIRNGEPQQILAFTRATSNLQITKEAAFVGSAPGLKTRETETT